MYREGGVRGRSCICGEEGGVNGVIYTRGRGMCGVGRWYQGSDNYPRTLRFGL